MTSRRRRFESSWDMTEETTPPAGITEKNPLQGKELQLSSREGGSPKWSNLEANDAVMPDDFSGRQSWEPSQGNGNMPKDDDINRDRHITQTDRTFNEWENQYNTRPSNDSYGPPYRGRDRGVGGNGIMSRERNRSRSRSWSPKRSRSRSRGRGSSRGLSRSRSRDRGRPRESARARSRSPFYDHRREPYEHTDTRNDSRVSSRPKCKDFAAGNCRKGSQCRFFHQESLISRDDGNRMNNDLPEKRSNRPEYSGGSRYGDDRNSADRPRNRGSDGYKNDDFHRGDRNLYDDQDRRRQSNRNSRVPCRFFAAGKCNRNDCKFSHDALESGAYQGRPHDNNRGQNIGDKNRTWNDRQPWDDLNETGFSEKFAKPNNSIDEKSKSSNGTSWDDVESVGFGERSRDDIHGRPLDDRNRTWNGPMSRDASRLSRHNSDDKKKVWDGPLWDEVDASGFSDIGKSSHHFDDNNKPIDGPSWDGTSASGFSNVPKPRHNSDDNKKSRNGTSRDTIRSSGAKSNNSIDGKRKSWNGPSWDEVSESGYSNIEKFNARDGNSTSRKRDDTGWNEKIFEKNDDFLSQKTSIPNYTDIASSETRTINHQEPRVIPDGSLSHTLDSHGHVMPQASGSQFTNAITAVKLELPGVSCLQQQHVQDDDDVVMEIDDSDVHNVDMASKDANQHILTSGNETIRSFDNIGFQSRRNGTEQSQQTHPSIPLNGLEIQPNGSAEGVFLSMDSHNQAQMQNNKDPKPQEAMETIASSEQFPQVSGLPQSLPEISQKGQLPQAYIDLHLANAIELLYSLPSAASSGLRTDPMVVQHNLDTRPKEQYHSTISMEATESVKTSLPMGILSGSVGQENQMPVKRSSPIPTGGPHSSKPGAIGVPREEQGKSPKSKKEDLVRNLEGHENKAKKPKKEQENINTDNSEAKGKVEEGNNSNDEKAMRLFKTALVEFVKEILKPTWKEGKMSREVHKTIVKKVVDKVSSAIQGNQIPRTQEKITHYLAFSKSKITKLVEAYVERNLKA